ncbi:hypothetical protein [Micromonospora sp. NBRC 101691]|uniref:hypothetical protein n=1 Tax=Micromonospora sp. NBRC 101691 TaxID=3032198 RepID=UPI0024A4DDDC|nr:hypothetical protein [Micromonospora sp. NBRC 101691]GLY23502.1 hypothetical protein Misp04_32340 [Micromonospora sp. NBRC 101691]
MSRTSDHSFDDAKAYAVTMTVRQWQWIDATIDNEVDRGSSPRHLGVRGFVAA